GTATIRSFSNTPTMDQSPNMNFSVFFGYKANGCTDLGLIPDEHLSFEHVQSPCNSQAIIFDPDEDAT
ncbi:MAG: hypothetical protein ACI9MF_000671, partial [Gammaproteobacteria bacterium]